VRPLSTGLPYPRWRFFPSYAVPPAWVANVVAIFAANRAHIDSAVTHAKRMESNDVLGVIENDLRALGFEVEQGKQKAGKLPRPVFFGDEGTFLRTYEIDAFEPGEGIALEVEAGRATMGNAMRAECGNALTTPSSFGPAPRRSSPAGVRLPPDAPLLRGDVRQSPTDARL
jgi:hypothetical protein